MDIKFYMQREGIDDSPIDIEEYFKAIDLDGNVSTLRYSKCEGLEAKGKIKNIYTEDYADSNELRVYLPDEVAREATKITFTFFFFGKQKQMIYDAFCDFIKGYKIFYYDTKRLKKAYMVNIEKTEPTEDYYKGEPYMIVDFVFQNLWGQCRMAM